MVKRRPEETAQTKYRLVPISNVLLIGERVVGKVKKNEYSAKRGILREYGEELY